MSETLDLDGIEARAKSASDRPVSRDPGVPAEQRALNAWFITTARRDVLDLVAEVRALRRGSPRDRPRPGRALVALSEWIDAGNAHRDPEAVTWGRLAKITEEAGEVIAAYIGATGQNRRKGRTCDLRDVREELLDVAVTALGAYEHLAGHDGSAMDDLADKIIRVADRARVSASRKEP